MIDKRQRIVQSRAQQRSEVLDLSICILTKNSERSLRETLDSLKLFSEVIILDTGSTDKTLEIAKEFQNVRVFKRPFTGFGMLRNEAALLAANDWILALDSDEILSAELQNDLKERTLKEECVYEIDFKNFYRGRQIKGCGWQPEQHVRLYNRKKTSFFNAQVHEGVITEGFKKIRINQSILHTPYRSVSDFLAKMQHYSDLFAKEHCGKKSSSFSKAFFHGLGAFIKTYFLKRGIFMGREGFMIALYNANTAFYKYLKLEELNAARSPLPPS